MERNESPADGIPALELGQFFEVLVGRWRLQREIPGIARFSGEADFAATGSSAVLAYAEFGVLAMTSGHNAPASRRLLYCRIGDQLAIKDDDARRRGALLHLLAFARPSCGTAWLVASHRHRCGEDAYDLEMRVLAPDRFETRYHVVGRRKNYRMFTVYKRMLSIQVGFA
jgi:hypothetical protein